MNRKIIEILRYILAFIVVSGFFILLYILLFKPVIPENQRILDVVIGSLIGQFSAVISYFFGSSSGSAEKTKLLSEKKEITEDVK